jgi:hypothetical protein
MVELYQITREVAPQVVGDKREDAKTKNLNAESSPLIKENLSEGQSFTAARGYRIRVAALSWGGLEERWPFRRCLQMVEAAKHFGR